MIRDSLTSATWFVIDFMDEWWSVQAQYTTREGKFDEFELINVDFGDMHEDDYDPRPFLQLSKNLFLDNGQSLYSALTQVAQEELGTILFGAK